MMFLLESLLLESWYRQMSHKQYVLQITWLDSDKVRYLVKRKEGTETRNTAVWTTDDPSEAKVFKKKIPQWELDHKYNICSKATGSPILKHQLKLELKELGVME